MKRIAALTALAFICISVYAQRNEVSDPSKKNDQEANVVKITPGSSGVKRGIGYKFLLRRGDEDPGNGLFRLNDDNVSDVRFIYVDNLDLTGEDQTKFYSSWDQITGATARGRITIADATGKVITVFYIKGVFVDGKGFWKLPVEYVSGELPIDGHVYYYVFDRIALKEEPVNTNLPAPVIPSNTEVTVTEVIPVNPVVPVVTVVNETEVVTVTEVIADPVVPVVPVVSVEKDSVVVPNTPVIEVINERPEVPVVKASKDTVLVQVTSVNEIVPVKQVKEVNIADDVVPVKPVQELVSVTEVVQDKSVVPVIPVKPDSIVAQASPVNPTRRVIKTDPEKPDSLINYGNQVNPARRTRPANMVNSDSVVSTAKKVIQAEQAKPSVPVSQAKPVIVDKPVNQTPPANPVSQPKPANPVSQPSPSNPVSQSKPANPVSQPKPANPVSQPKPVAAEKPVTQEKPANPVNQPKPSNPVSQAYPSNQGTQNYPVPEGSRLPSYQRYTGTSGGIHGKWYRGIIEAGYGLGVGDYGINNFRLNFINGFKIGNSSLGLGIGYRRYFTDNNTAPFLVSKKSEVPVFLDFRTHFSDRKVTPYFALGFGGTASADTTITGKDRLFFTTSGGVWFNLSDRFAVFAGIAYELQKLEFSDTNPYTGNYRKNSNSISLNIGIAF